MDVEKEIILLCNVLNLTETELGKKLNVTYETINNWKHKRKKIDNSNLEKLYSFAFDNRIRINNIYEQLLKEEYSINNNYVLFHGAKKEFSMPIDLKKSKKTNDFGVGFYLGETYEQAANYISALDSNLVYAFRLNVNGLKEYKFDVDNKWMIAIAYYRGWLNDMQ